MKIFHAKTQRGKEMLVRSFAPLRLCVEKLIAIAIALSFFAILVPISSASSDRANAMACCVDKAAGHCDSGIPAKKTPPPAPEPMCGLDNSELENDAITIVAKPSHDESHNSLSQTVETNAESTLDTAESTSVSKPCQMECGACTASASRQQRRERGIVQPATDHNSSLVAYSRFENQPFFYLSDEDWEQTSPRGPPADLL
jgi:hypothetical protein